VRIAIDGAPLGWRLRAGITRYAGRLAASLAAEFPRDRVSVTVPLLSRRGLAGLREARRALRGTAVRVRPVLPSPGLLGAIWARSSFPRAEAVFGRAKVYHATSLAVPIAGCGAASVATLYDFYFLREPGYPSAPGLRREGLSTLARADRLIAISRATAHDAAELLRLDPERIDVIPLAADERFRPDIAPAEIARVRNRLGLEGRPYLAFTGTIEPRKDLPTLVRAFASLRRRGVIPHRLAIAGARGWGAEALERALAEEHLGPEDVTLLGALEDDDLPPFLAGAALFCFPTLYEGFGLPLVEAMACGTPVLSTRTSSVPEVVGDCAILVEPRDPAALAAALEALANDAVRRSELARRGLERARWFSWARVARETRASYERALASASGGVRAVRNAPLRG